MASLRSPQTGCSPCSSNSSRTPFFAGRTPASSFLTCKRWDPETRLRLGVVSVEAKGRKSGMMPGGGRKSSAPTPAMPKMDDDDNPKFVLFIRTKKVPRWYPLSIVSGGTTAKMMLGAMKNDWGKKLYSGTLTRNIAAVIYKDERAVRQTAFKTYPVLKSASGFEYGYKVVIALTENFADFEVVVMGLSMAQDSKNPKAALFASDVIQIPPEEELKSVVDKVKEGFGNIFSSVKESFGSISSLTSEEGELKPESEAETKK